MLQDLKELLNKEYNCAKEIGELLKAKTDAEKVSIANKMIAKVEAVNDLNFNVLQLLKENDRKNKQKDNDSGGSDGAN